MTASQSIRDSESYGVIGAAMAVHRELGHGFLEAVYQEAMERQLELSRIPYLRQVSYPLAYRGKPLRTSYRADLVCFGSLIVEVKATRLLSTVDEAQVINYLKASGLARGILLNFGSPSLEYRRLVLRFDQSAESA